MSKIIVVCDRCLNEVQEKDSITDKLLGILCFNCINELNSLPGKKTILEFL